MKNYFAILFFSSLLFYNCSPNDSVIEDVNSITITWNLIKVTGGVANINVRFDEGTIVWHLNETNNKLTVENNNTNSRKEDFLDSGTYNYSYSTINNNKFIFTEGDEHGLMTIVPNQFTINENVKTTGESNNGFVYTFKRVIVIE